MAMADISKQVWKFQEGLVIVLLEQLGVPKRQIFWGAKPKGLSVDTDILIGESLDNPRVAILVTHNSADSAGLMKFWRSINELLELKTAFPKLIASNLHFESGVPPITDLAMREFFDMSLSLGEHASCNDLVTTAHEVTEQSLIGLQRDVVLEFLRSWVTQNKRTFASCFKQLSEWLEKSIEVQATDMAWKSILTPCVPDFVGQVGVHSGYRKGFAKLTLLSDDEIQLVANGVTGAVLKHSTVNLQALQITGSAVGGDRLIDQDIIQIFREIPREYIDAVRQSASNSMAVLPRLKDQLSSISTLPAYANWLCANWEKITAPKSLSVLLDECFKDPTSVGPKITIPVSWHWLLDLIIYVIKQTRGSRHGFSLSKLSQEVGATGVIGRNNRLQFSYYIERKRNLPLAMRDALAETLARLLLEGTTPSSIPPVVSELLSMRVTGVLERMMNGQEFEPIYWLLKDACSSSRLSFVIDKAVESIVSDFHPKKPGTTKLALIGGSSASECLLAVHCRTAHDGATDKRKELCARGRTLRARVTSGVTRDQFTGKLALVLDGDFTRKDVELLARSGWTRIYGVTDIPKLIQDCLDIRIGGRSG